ncbi:Retrovirus-related Pol polyprotein from transposon TNT 1-94 [Phytophthora rubi]|uniref:Retrovirus-related Pol polyprotein from transposon TNT 1-94 n=1 Tax=Phytophthora rubi TaxID=129364 RepID=A0A6A3JDE6_9STRA|nr:Retrovirus-related Pol polyprotein from transposon TNT 1-94 [Phytophthora rubi]
MGKMREDNFSRNPEKAVKSAGVLDLIHSDVMGPMQTKTPGGCTYAVTFIDDFSRHVTVYFMKKKTEVLEKFKMFKTDMENATGLKIKRHRSDNGGEYTGRLFKEYLSKQGIRHEKTVPYTPQQNGLAERMNRSIVEMARCMLYHEGIDKKWWAEAVNTSAWMINRIPNTVTVKTPYEIVYQKKPQLKNLKVFGALGYGHMPDEKRRKLDAKAFKCRFLGYEDGVKGYRVLNVATGQVKIVRTVKFMETTSTGDFMTEVEGDDKDGDEDVAAPHATAPSHGQTQTLTIFNDEVVPLQHEVTTETAIVPAPSHSMITRSRTRPNEETTDPEEAEGRKKQIVAPSAIGTKRQKVSQARVKPSDELLAIEGGQLMAATEEVPKTYAEATTRQDQDEWKKAIASELKSLIVNKTWKLVPKPAHQRPIGCRWVFALKRDEKGQVVRYKARLVAKGYSQRHGTDYEETYSPVAYLNSIRAMLAKCSAEGMEIEQCDVDTAFLYGKLEEEIYMELPEGLRELLELAEAEGEDDVDCMLLQSLYGLKQASRVWNETIDKHLNSMGFEPADANPCVYTRGEGDDECIVCLYVDDMLIASRQKAVIASVKAGIAENFRIKDLGRARFILGIEIDYDMERRTLGISQKAYTESIIKKFGQENAKPCLTPLEPSVQLTKADEPQTEEDKAKMKSKPYRSLVGSLMYLACGTRPDISVAVAKLSRFLENPGEKHWDAGIKVVRYLLKTKDVSIVYEGLLGTQLEAYSDADWAGNRDDRRSVSGMLLMLCGAPVVWRSMFQKTVALSSTEAEYMALSDCVKECVWIRRLLKEIGAEQVGATVIYEDNQGAMALAKNVGYQARTKHIDIRYHFIRKKVVSNEVELEYVDTKNQLADFMTKGLSSKTLRYLMMRSNVGPKLETSN